MGLRAATLRIRSGKTTAARVTLPIATDLRDYLAPLVARAKAEERPWLLRRNRHAATRPPAKAPTRRWPGPGR